MHFLIMFIGGMCLEIYIVQPQLLMRFTMLSIFPLNIVVVFIIIVVCAYALVKYGHKHSKMAYII